MNEPKHHITYYHASSYGFLTRIIIMTLAAMLAAYILPGVTISNFFVGAITVFVISILDNLIRPGLIIVTLPFNTITQNLLIFVINALIVLFTAKLIRGFSIPGGFWPALIFSLILTLVDYLLQLPGSKPQRQTYQPQQPDPSDDPNHFDDYEEIK